MVLPDKWQAASMEIRHHNGWRWAQNPAGSPSEIRIWNGQSCALSLPLRGRELLALREREAESARHGGRERVRETKNERERERESARGGRSLEESISAHIGTFQPTWVELGSCSALLVKSSNSPLEHPSSWVQPGHRMTIYDGPSWAEDPASVESARLKFILTSKEDQSRWAQIHV
jgi:hypothetical protein